MPIAADPNRALLSVAGPDSAAFLQGLLTNDVSRAAPDRAVYAALLTPQGKFLFDAIVTAPSPEELWLDTPADTAADLLKRLTMYKLRAAVTLARLEDRDIARVWGGAEAPSEAELTAPDPRDPALGLRAVVPRGVAPTDPEALAAHETLRLELGIPAAGGELLPNLTFPLEAGFERAQGVDFKKGCFVGQEIVARMKHKAELKKRLLRVRLEGAPPPPGAEITAGGRPAGVMGSSQGDLGLAVLRTDRLDQGALAAGDTALQVLDL